MILVTGATGHYGRQVVEGLLKKVPAAKVGVSVRDPEKTSGLGGQGVRVSKADFSDPNLLAAAFDGAEQVLLVSASVLGEEAVRLHGIAIRSAKNAGVKRILYTSHQAASPHSKVAFARDHAKTEDLLRECGTPFVSLRNGFYAESLLYQLGGIRETGKLALPADGPVSWTLRRDLAEAAVTALTSPGLFDGITAPLTASRTYTFGDVAGMASVDLRRPITFETISADMYKRNALERGFAEGIVDMLLTMFDGIRGGEFNVIDPTLERVLARRPAELQEVLSPFLQNQSSNAH